MSRSEDFGFRGMIANPRSGRARPGGARGHRSSRVSYGDSYDCSTPANSLGEGSSEGDSRLRGPTASG